MRTLTENGQTFVLVPLADFERMTRNSEDIGDIAAFDAAMERDEEAFPITLLDAIEAGENPIKAFRTYRGTKQAELAHMTNISPAYLSQLENGAREGSVKMVKAIAVALNVPSCSILPADRNPNGILPPPSPGIIQKKTEKVN